MLTKLTIRRFKRFKEVEIELGNPVVFIGPNDSGKTSALQALVLWDIGLKKWLEKRAGQTLPEKRPGVTINRRDLMAVPVPGANLLWRNLHVRNITKVDGKQKTNNVYIDILIEGVLKNQEWKCGFEFYYANEESFYCRPLRLSDNKTANRMKIPNNLQDIRVVFLPPMSGLAEREFYKQPGEVNFLIGQGRTAEVLRVLCFETSKDQQKWNFIKERIEQYFGITIESPLYIPERSEIIMRYKDRSGIQLDLSSSGRGMQQTLLLISFMMLNPSSIILLDEPDAHQEILRQRQTYELLSEIANEHGSQIIAASHSEVILNEAAGRDVVMAFLGKPHRIDDRGSQLLKSLREIGYEHYYQAEQTGWVLYLEGSTDLKILQSFAKTLDHPALESLQRPFVHYVCNQPQKARDHFYGLREAKTDLVGIAIFDHLNTALHDQSELREIMWSKCEIENYLCQKETLLNWAEAEGEKLTGGPLLAQEWIHKMEETISEIETALQTLGKEPWSSQIKASDDFLNPLFKSFFKKLKLPNLMEKSDYHVLASYLPKSLIDPEIITALGAIVETAAKANPLQNNENA
ncbi:MAG: AAA family ATPase [Candidatus Omnitrophota bacterium]|jgi:hypothetical protein|nr:MAG: AAA family ATPase [Candidatus Omnitrophota bacterium]